jgi:Na+/melibiose symporter-like transporter
LGNLIVFEFTDVAVAHAVQLAVAPVFLLSGIGAMLAVMTSRLGRIIDRARDLEERLVDASPEYFSTLQTDLRMLSQRAKLIYLAIALCTTTALLVCAVVAFLFVSAFLQFDASVVVALLFIAAMSTFVFGLLWFLREIYVGTISLRIGPP